MTDIVLTPITSGYNLAKINANFVKLQNVVNNDIIHNVGGNNVMHQPLDMNFNKLLNVYTDLNDPNSLLSLGVADSRYYNVAGDLLTGPMNAGFQRINNLPMPLTQNEAARKIDVDNARAYAEALTAGVIGGYGFFQQTGLNTVARTFQDKQRETRSVKDYGAKGDGVTDDSAAIQLGLDSGFPLFVPEGTYVLNTPLKVKSGACLYGVNGRDAGFGKGSYFKPATSAIISNDFNTQYVTCTLHNIGFIGGTTQVDLGLFHEVDIENCWFYGPSVGALVIVRGEKQRIMRCRVDATLPAIFGFSLGRWEESTSGIYSDAYFGVDGAFFDRATIQDVHMQAGAVGYFAYGIKSNIFSAISLIDFIVHGGKKVGEVSCIWVRDRIQISTFINVNPDNFGNATTPATSIFHATAVLNCSFINCSPQFAQNNSYITGWEVTSSFRSTWVGCRSDGDNSTIFGFRFGAGTGQAGTMINCRGAFFHSGANSLVRAQIVQIDCEFTGGNNGGSNNSNVADQDSLDLLMADTNGAAASTARWGAQFSAGGGAGRVPFYVRTTGPFVMAGLGISMLSAFGEASPIKILVNGTNNITPEGVVTANPGSLYMFYNGLSQGKLYVKETGTGNTGWVIK